VSEDNLDIFGVGYAVGQRTLRGTNLTMLLLIFVIILLVVNLAWFVFFRRMKKK
jgi:hypothetical protein